jgi:hypothetical protein
MNERAWAIAVEKTKMPLEELMARAPGDDPPNDQRLRQITIQYAFDKAAAHGKKMRS